MSSRESEGPTQDQSSRTFWDRIGRSTQPGDLHGLLDQDARMARYRHAAEVQVLHEKLPQLGRARRVLEVGCGGGRWTVELARTAERVVATDIAPSMIERARERLAAAEGVKAAVEFHVCPFQEMPFEGPFDLVYLGSCLHYIEEPQIAQGLAGLDRILAPGAILLTRDTVSLLGRSFHRRERYGGDDPAIYRPVAEYEAMFARHGWRLDAQWPTYVTPWAWKLRSVLPDALLQRLLRRALPGAGAAVEAAAARPLKGDKAHCFFVYRRAATP